MKNTSVSLPRSRFCLVTQRSLGRRVAWRDKKLNGREGDYTSVKVLMKRISFTWSQCRSSSTDSNVSTTLGDSIIHSGSERSTICRPEEGWYGQPKYCYEKTIHVVMISFAVVFGLLFFFFFFTEKGNLPTIQLCHRRSLSTIPPLLSTTKRNQNKWNQLDNSTLTVSILYLNPIFRVN